MPRTRRLAPLLLSLGILLAAGSNAREEAREEGQDAGPAGGVVCDGEYALCTSAPCIPDPTNQESRAICACDVHRGPNYGFSSCERRRPIVDEYGTVSLRSTYSFRQAPTKPVMTCPGGNPWTDCLDMPCNVDPMNPRAAICTCKIQREGEFVTYGGDCNTLTCQTAYWSAATPKAFLVGSAALMESLDIQELPPKFCPGMKR